MKMVPLFDRIIVKRLGQDETENEAIVVGKVKSVGESVKSKVREGDNVLLIRHAGVEVNIDGEDCQVIREDDILGIIAGNGEENAWEKLKEAFPDKYVCLQFVRMRYSKDISDGKEAYCWAAYVNYKEKGIEDVLESRSSTPIDTVNNLIKKVKSLLKAKEDEK